MEELAFVLHGPEAKLQTGRERTRQMALMTVVNGYKPIRDAELNKVPADTIREWVIERIEDASDRHILQSILDEVKAHDSALYYFVLVATYRMPKDIFRQSLRDNIQQFEYKQILGMTKGGLSFGSGSSLPRLLWDLTPVLDERLLVRESSMLRDDAENIDPSSSTIRSYDEWGRLSIDCLQLLRNKSLRISSRLGRSIKYIVFTPQHFLYALARLLAGYSSDVFQINEENDEIQLLENAMVEEEMDIEVTRQLSRRYILLGNRLQKERVALEELKPKRRLSRLLIQARDKEDIHFEESLYALVTEAADTTDEEETDFQSVAETMHNLAEGMLRMTLVVKQILTNEDEHLMIPLLQSFHAESQQAETPEATRKAWFRVQCALLQDVIRQVENTMLSGKFAATDSLFHLTPVPKNSTIGQLWQRRLGVSFFLPGRPQRSSLIRKPLLDNILETILLSRILNGTKIDDQPLAKFYGIESTELLAGEEATEDRLMTMFEEEVERYVHIREDNILMPERLLQRVYESSPSRSATAALTSALLADAKRLFHFISRFFFVLGFVPDDMSPEKLQEAILRLPLEKRFLNYVTIDITPKPIFGHQLSLQVPESLSIFLPRPAIVFYSNIRSLLCILITAENYLTEVTTHYPLFRWLRLTLGDVIFLIRLHIQTNVQAIWDTFEKKMSLEPQTMDSLVELHKLAYREVRAVVEMEAAHSALEAFICMMSDTVKQCADAMLEGDEISAQRSWDTFYSDFTIFTDKLALEPADSLAHQLLSRLVPPDLR